MSAITITTERASLRDLVEETRRPWIDGVGSGEWFVRLTETPKQGRRYDLSAGVFQIMYRLRRRGVMSYADADEMDGLRRWFNRNLPAPKQMRHEPALFWFRGEALRQIPQYADGVERLAALMSRYAVDIDLVITDRPGRVRYSDPLQIAAVPFRETFTRLREPWHRELTAAMARSGLEGKWRSHRSHGRYQWQH